MIFVTERFFWGTEARSKNPDGSGLGLAIAKEAVILHGGEIKLSSEEGLGCVFSVYIPANAEGDVSR